MNRSRVSPTALAIIGLIIVLAIAYGLDALMVFLARRNSQTFTLSYVILWSRVFGSFLLAAALLFLFRFVLDRAARAAWIAALYLIVGLFFALFPGLYHVPALGSWMPQTLVRVLFSLSSYTFLAGSFIAVTGLFMLILPRR